VSIDGTMTAWLRTALVSWAGGVMALTTAVFTSAGPSPFPGTAGRVARWPGLVAVVLFAAGGLLFIGGALAA
jgi:hypothetical protein